MTIKPININNNTKSFSFKKKEYKPYLEAEGAVNTQNNVKPLPGKGHLIHDTFGNKVKYFFEDIAYDIKSVKNGFNGTANDHQSGRLNDVGLKLGGIGIATYLASKTTDPRARLMEYVGLGAFLAAMNVYPKIAINAPAKMVHGFDIDKQFIDDQGRKKSVYQDPNYIPYDLYRGEAKGEDFSDVGDKMGIPKSIEDRDELTKEQTRKISTQSNTLWMLTAGVTPAITALVCCGLEEPLAALMEKIRNSSYNNQISKTLKKTSAMGLDVADIKNNHLSNKVQRYLSHYNGQEMPERDFKALVRMFTKNMDANTSEGIKKDLANILKTSKLGTESIVLNSNTADEILNTISKSIPGNTSAAARKILVPSRAELDAILEKYASRVDIEAGTATAIENLDDIRNQLKTLIDSKIDTVSDKDLSAYLKARRNEIVENAANTLKTKKSAFVTQDTIKEISDFAKIIGDFKQNEKVLDKCKSFKVEAAPQTTIARSYNKFQNTLLKELKISFKELKLMKESESASRNILDKKIAELCKDEARYNKTIEKLGKISSEMEIKLHGSSETESFMKDLFTAIEENYNNTARRLNKLDSNKFKNTIDRLVKEDVSTLSTTTSTKKDLIEFLDGLRVDKYANVDYWNGLDDAGRFEYAKFNAKGVGSSKNLATSRIVDRYSGAQNSFNRALHTLDVYKRAENPELFSKNSEYAKELIKEGKATLLNANSSQHTLKLNTVNDSNFYKDLMNAVWKPENTTDVGMKSKGFVTDSTKKALEKVNEAKSGNILDRFQQYITRFRHIVGNSSIDFTKPDHVLDKSIKNSYQKGAKTRLTVFNLIGQNPVDMVRDAARNKYLTGKWLRIMGGITAGVFSIAVLSQFAFGKIRNPQNIKKQVSDDTNK